MTGVQRVGKASGVLGSLQTSFVPHPQTETQGGQMLSNQPLFHSKESERSWFQQSGFSMFSTRGEIIATASEVKALIKQFVS